MFAVSCQKLYSDVKLPFYATDEATGADLYAYIPHQKLVLAPGKRLLIPTGLAIALGKGFEAQVRSRSGLAIKYGVVVLNGVGTIDSDYRGELYVPLINLGEEDYIIESGDRIAQLVISASLQVNFLETTQLSPTLRGTSGFGSSGK